MVAEVPDLVEGSASNMPFGAGVHLETTAVQSESLNAFGNGYTPKVRKPYTITKQREKWTQEEHQRFLEALKLYGRAWRQIEEHIGTKTAIQIRSHAQKFFTKVARDPNLDSAGSLNPIEIPPPRPKKKPLHPYPRKVVDSQKTVADSNQDEQFPPPNVTGEERDTGSPTSVLSAIGSDTSGSPFLELQKSSRFSPTSCTSDDAHSANVLLVENENECMTSNSCVEEEKRSLQSTQVSPTRMDTKPMMETDLLTLGGACSVDDPATDEPSTTIKLFGRMVVVKESKKLSPISTENHGIIPNNAANERLGVRNDQPTQNFPTPNIDPRFAFAFVPGSVTPLPCLVPQYALTEECKRAGVVSGHIPWWTWYRGVAFPQVSFGNQIAGDSVLDSPYKREEDNELREGSLTGSNSGSSSEVNSLQTKTNAIESKVKAKLLKQGSSKGFVPYKRCLVERETASPIVAAQEREGQRARVFL